VLRRGAVPCAFLDAAAASAAELAISPLPAGGPLVAWLLVVTAELRAASKNHLRVCE